MARLKTKGDLAELKVATDLLSRGCRIALPFGEDCDYDLIADTGDDLHRIQVKHVTSDGAVCEIHCMSHSLTNGKIRQTKRYTAETIDWLAVYDRTTERCFSFPRSSLARGVLQSTFAFHQPETGSALASTSLRITKSSRTPR
jgi:PD-(D/E)XK endonuclease